MGEWPLAIPPRPRPRHGLTEAERALWQLYIARTHVAPMPGKALPPAPALILPVPAVAPATPALATAPTPRAQPHHAAELLVGAAPPGLDGRRWKELRRGRTRPERTLDLHGRRVHDAHGAVRRFLADAVADGIRCVAIVTGKGSTEEGGVLRRELPHWLNASDLRHLLLGAAHPHATNPGAVHLLLRKHPVRPRG